jgi:hypothetical protein
MKSRWINIFWSVMMIAGGAIFLLREAGVVDFELFSNLTWAVVFGVLSAFFFLTYFLKGVRNWGWLFPAMILGALAAIVGLDSTVLGETLSGALILMAIAIPFLVVFAIDPKKNWWALIPAWVMSVLSAVVLFESRLSGNLVGTLVLYGIALPFLVIYLLDKNKRWALIPFGALTVVGIIPVLDEMMSGDMLGMVVMFLFAIPFLVVYFWSKKQWWALIPAGVFISIGLTVLLLNISLTNNWADGIERLAAAVMMAGIGATFGALWLKRESYATDWAKYPALGCFAVAVLAFILGQNSGLLWPVVLIAGGAGIIVWGFLKRPVVKDEEVKE